MPRKYKQLTQRDRVLISRLKAIGYSQSEIAKRLRTNRSTICRELKRNTHGSHWRAEDAEKIRKGRAARANGVRRGKRRETLSWVIEKLKLNWSPEQIAGRSGIEGPEKLCTETVYSFLRKDRKEGGGLHRLLKRFRKRKSRFCNRDYSAKPTIPNRIGIEKRPSLVNERSRLGDLEGDLVVGYKQSGYVITVVDRTSLAVALEKIERKTKSQVLKGLKSAIARLGHAHTLTLDNGREFAAHQTLTHDCGVSVFFARPYASHERGTVENTNGLLRYYLPKKTSFGPLNSEKLNLIEQELNTRPRKVLAYLTPQEVHSMHSNTNTDCCT
ncbi:MAG: IS30 family transposase [Bdellovibrionia bacterium]